AVSQRTHEIGVRMAIGARPAEIVRMILSQGMGLALVGVIIGVATAFALTRAVKSFLFGVPPNDPATFFTVAAVLAAAALAACYLPARRAAQVDPLRPLPPEWPPPLAARADKRGGILRLSDEDSRRTSTQPPPAKQLCEFGSNA